MSYWTHVCGSMSLDTFTLHRRDKAEKILQLEKIFIQSSSEDYEEECNMPLGSEGSIQREIYVNDDLRCTNTFTISFWGNLRDFGGKETAQVEDIKDWFIESMKILEDNDITVRTASLFASDGRKNISIGKYFGNDADIFESEYGEK